MSDASNGSVIAEIIKWISTIITLGTAITIIWKTKKYAEAVETIERVGPLVEGNPKEHTDELKRLGLLGRTKRIEDISSLTTKQLEKQYRMFRAVLKGFGIPSDLSDEHKLEITVKERVSDFDYKAAREELISDHEERISTLEPNRFELESIDRDRVERDRYDRPIDRNYDRNRDLPGQYRKVLPVPKTPTNQFDPEDTQSGKKRRR